LGRIPGVSHRGPGYPLQFFLPGRAKKDFRFYPLREDLTAVPNAAAPVSEILNLTTFPLALKEK
jgi:hypothetical protein